MPVPGGASECHEHVRALVEAVFALGRARAMGVFACGDGPPWLVASQNLDRHGLDAVAAAWSHGRDTLRLGVPRIASDGLVLPCRHGRELTGLLYVEGGAPHDRATLMVSVALVVAAVLAARPATADGAAHPAEDGDGEAESCLVAVQNCGWNVSLAARVMGVARMTVYHRLRRAGVATHDLQRRRRDERYVGLQDADTQ